MPQTTHDIIMGSDHVIKRFRSWERGEPDREWQGLELLDRFAPGLAPKPIRRTNEAGRPEIVMSRLDGVALGSRPLTSDQVAGLASALTTLHTAVPSAVVQELPRRLWCAADAVDSLRVRVSEPPGELAPRVRGAFELGAEWINSDEATRFAGEETTLVFAQADGNLANAIWDWTRCGLVDFEGSGASDRAFELADLVEHVTAWLTGVLDADDLLSHLELDQAVSHRIHLGRRVMALFWLLMLMPGNPGYERNPEGSLDRQAGRLLGLFR
jgi:aminoglycoside phosphotransferase